MVLFVCFHTFFFLFAIVDHDLQWSVSGEWRSTSGVWVCLCVCVCVLIVCKLSIWPGKKKKQDWSLEHAVGGGCRTLL